MTTTPQPTGVNWRTAAVTGDLDASRADADTDDLAIFDLAALTDPAPVTADAGDVDDEIDAYDREFAARWDAGAWG